MKKLLLLCCALLTATTAYPSRSNIEDALIGGACTIAAACAAFKIGLSVRGWYTSNYTIPALISEAHNATSSIKQQQMTYDSYMPNLMSIHYQNSEADLALIAQHQNIFSSTEPADVSMLRQRLAGYEQEGLLNTYQQSTVHQFCNAEENFAKTRSLIRSIEQTHRPYFQAYNLLQQLQSISALLVEYFGIDAQTLAPHVTVTKLRQCFGYKSDHDHYLVLIVQRLERTVSQINNLIVHTHTYRQLHAELCYIREYIDNLTEIITRLPKYHQHLVAYKQYCQHQEQLRLEQERLKIEKERLAFARTQAIAAQRSAEAAQENNRLTAERNRLERQRLASAAQEHTWQMLQQNLLQEENNWLTAERNRLERERRRLEAETRYNDYQRWLN